jgi:hypothetical protein
MNRIALAIAIIAAATAAEGREWTEEGIDHASDLVVIDDRTKLTSFPLGERRWDYKLVGEFSPAGGDVGRCLDHPDGVVECFTVDRCLLIVQVADHALPLLDRVGESAEQGEHLVLDVPELVPGQARFQAAQSHTTFVGRDQQMLRIEDWHVRIKQGRCEFAYAAFYLKNQKAAFRRGQIP